MVLLFSCAQVGTDKEIEALKMQVEQLSAELVHQKAIAEEAAAVAKAAQAEAERQVALSREQQAMAEKALEDCK